MYEVVTKPDTPVVSLQQVKAHLRLDHVDDDDYLLHLIYVAMGWVEDLIESPLLTATYRIRSSKQRIHLPTQNLIGIVSVVGITSDGQRKSLPYNIERGSIVSVSRPYPHIEVLYTCGFGDRPMDVPPPLRQVILNHVACHYECRTQISKEQYLMLLQLISPYRRVGLS
ncbi:MAG: phage head-tail connector protein [Candidatus Paracaedibacteraceae bacterium]|nr:phage head-tail connector protein [Candidatus Paracaedibacteraceae bacterium]